MGEKNNLVLVVGAIAAFVLQIALAPAVALFSAQPNFLLAYALVVAIVIPTEAGPVLPFVMGLLYDLTGTGPVGGMALLLVIACFLATAPWAWWSTSSWRGCLPAAPRTAVCARRNCDRGRACSQLS